MYTIEDYKWNLNPRFIRIMCADNTRIHYMSEKESKLEIPSWFMKCWKALENPLKILSDLTMKEKNV